MAAEENIKVAVRLRPFLQNVKEEAEGKRKRIVRMDELSSSVSITNPNDTLETHKFIFDNVLWSFDGYVEQADGYFTQENKAAVSDEVYCDQKQVYDEVGKDMVRNLWDGYKSTIFTFGESRSGKSWTLLGLGANKGIAVHALTDIFRGVRDKERTFQQSGSILEVRLTMAEVYNERVKDLLPASFSNSTKFKSSVKIRDHSKKGFYIDGLRSVILTNLEDGQQRLDEGFMNRAVFLTSVNGTAGNSITTICVTLVQRIRNHRGDEVTRISSLELIDLPACDVSSFSSNSNSNEDDQDSLSETTPNVKNAGIRSLSNCVDMLLEASLGRLEDDMIPFQDHALTKLLRTSLSGNGRTFVMLTLSPSDISYDSSLFALQFADKIRMLSTKSVVNEEVTSKLIRELKAENDRLRKLISLGDFESNDLSNRKLNSSHNQSTGVTRLEMETFRRGVAENMKAQIKENEREMRNLQQPLEERLKQFKMDKNDSLKKVEIDKRSKCHIFNLNKDAQICGKIVHILPMGSVDFGQGPTSKGKEANAHYITICGPGIRDHHGTFSFNSKDGKFSVKPSGPNCKILVNESPIQFETVLSNNDRLVLGSNQIWIYQNPKDTWLEKYAFAHKLHYDFVQGEMAMKSEHYKNLNYDGYLSEKGHTQVAELIGALEDAKSISEDLSQNFTCQPLLLQSIEHFIRESVDDGRSNSETNNTRKLSKLSYSLPPTQNQYSTELMTLVKVENCVDGTFHYWSTQKFFERLEQLKDSYIQFLEDPEAPLKEVEALRESPDADVPIGYSILSLKPLAYLTNIEMKVVPILDYVTFQTIGTIRVALQICGNESDMKINDAEVFLESPEELIGERVTAVMSLSMLERIGMQFKDVYCKYKFPDGESVITPKLDSVPPNIMGKSSKNERRFSLESVNENILNILLNEHLILRFSGKPRAHKLLNLTIGSLQITAGIRRNGATSAGNPVEMERTLTELKLKEMCEQRYQRRLNALKAVIDQSAAFGEESVPISLMKTVFEARSQNVVDQCLEQHKESLAEVPEEQEQKQLPPELKALKRCSEICCIC